MPQHGIANFGFYFIFPIVKIQFNNFILRKCMKGQKSIISK